MQRMNDAKRRIIIAIKTSGYEPKDGDRITEIAAVEMMGLEKTGNNFHTFLNPGTGNLTKCAEEYERTDKLKADTDASEKTIEAMRHVPRLFTTTEREVIDKVGMPIYLTESLRHAPDFQAIENKLMDYLRMYPDTVIITHDIGRLKKFLRNEMTKENWEELEKRFHDTKHGMMQKVHKLRKVEPPLYPKSKGVWSKGLKFDEICKYFGVSVDGRTYYGAMQDALMLADVVCKRKEVKMANIHLFPASKSNPERHVDDLAEHRSSRRQPRK
ncbi:MAG TPA: hypothetical protein VL360_04650 [Gammaproteobacteria bacterium]|jgi:DNA polymerase III epsilon subunit-like protein|nr:hypothetical protein [Gammaproteobacteria bacterium]